MKKSLASKKDEIDNARNVSIAYQDSEERTAIKVVSTCSVVPTRKTEKTNTSKFSRIELKPWDLNLLHVDAIQKGILFHKPQHQNVVDHLKVALARTLDFFPLLAGRLVISEHRHDNKCSSTISIHCNDEGVRFTHAIANGLKVADILLDSYNVPPRRVHSFFSPNGLRNIDGVSEPLVSVQVTELDDGFFIGVTMNHSIADGSSFWNFFNSWAEISSGSSSISKPPVFTSWSHETGVAASPIPINLSAEQLLANQHNNSPPLLLRERVFRFNKESIGKLKARANLEKGTQNISSLQALLSHIWRSVIRSRGGDLNQKASLKLVVDIRARLRPPLSKAYFGNAIKIASVEVTTGDALNNSLGWLAWEINKVVASQTVEEVTRFYEDYVKEPKLWKKSEILRTDHKLVISSSPRFNVYGTDFGWGKPLAARSGMANKFDGKITVFPGAEEGSVDFEVCLAPETLRAMSNDPQFMEAVIAI